VGAFRAGRAFSWCAEVGVEIRRSGTASGYPAGCASARSFFASRRISNPLGPRSEGCAIERAARSRAVARSHPRAAASGEAEARSRSSRSSPRRGGAQRGLRHAHARGASPVKPPPHPVLGSLVDDDDLAQFQDTPPVAAVPAVHKSVVGLTYCEACGAMGGHACPALAHSPAQAGPGAAPAASPESEVVPAPPMTLRRFAGALLRVLADRLERTSNGD